MAISAFQFPFIYLYYGLVKFHRTVGCHQKGHAQYGIFVDAAYHKDLFCLYIPHLERQL